MPLFGAHLSIAGGYYLACETAGRFACQTVQLFTKNNNQWAGKALGEQDIRLFKDALRIYRLQLGPHAPSVGQIQGELASLETRRKIAE